MVIGFGYRDDWEPYEFWEYTTTVYDRFLQIQPDWSDKGKDMRSYLQEFREELMGRFKEAGIYCVLDNKTAFGFRHKATWQLVYFGFYDGNLIIGPIVRGDGWLRPHRKGEEKGASPDDHR
jgi:hypothetical protein